MDVRKMIAELREESARLEEAIINLEKLSSTPMSRRGRPAAWRRVTGVTAPQSGNGHNGQSNGVVTPSPA